jgi:hypothetical protein
VDSCGAGDVVRVMRDNQEGFWTRRYASVTRAITVNRPPEKKCAAPIGSLICRKGEPSPKLKSIASTSVTLCRCVCIGEAHCLSDCVSLWLRSPIE